MNNPINEIAQKLKSLNPREAYPHFVGGNETTRQEMLTSLGLNSLEELYSHISPEVLFQNSPKFEHLEFEQIIEKIQTLSSKNKIMTSFIGDGFHAYKVPSVTSDVAKVRGLATAYTPYQPERSQGTLVSLWIYQSLIRELTGVEAINASFYERSTCLYEAITCATRLQRSSKVLISDGIYSGDIEVIKTLAAHTPVELEFIPNKDGLVDYEFLKEKLEKENYAAVAFSQTNQFGLVEDVDTLTNLVHQYNAKVISVFDPLAIAETGLKAPVEYGENGADLIVAEAQSLCLDPNYGGPGLGLFGIRYNEEDKRSIRQSAGRFIGKTIDIKNQECLTLILSTREQHIRREKATSNICSNQSFVASLAGAGLLARGTQGLNAASKNAHDNAKTLATQLLQLEGVELAYNHAFFNEFVLKLSKPAKELISKGLKAGLEIGIDFTQACGFEAIKICTTDKHDKSDLDNLINFFKNEFEMSNKTPKLPTLESKSLRGLALEIPKISDEDIIDYYNKLGDLNLSPDDAIYPLGSCTMKYNPYINEWAASQEGFTKLHPQAPLENSQGSLELLYNIQELFTKITGLPAVTTQPVAGAQGELVGIKMFQAYHANRGDLKRKYILIPQTAHGTNPATASMAGYLKEHNGGGILLVKASQGEIDLDQIQEYINEYGDEIAGIMVTNPNTAGIFERNFKKMADMIHNCGGLVYMDGANMNAIAGWVDLGELGVDAVHNNLHKTWSIPHGGGGPGDAIVAVSHRLSDFLPGHQVVKKDNQFQFEKTKYSIGSFHRHHGNFAHKVRCYTYLLALGSQGTRLMSAYSVLSARYLYSLLKDTYKSLPKGADEATRMHEFIVTFSEEDFQKLQSVGLKKTDIIPRVGKLFLDFGFHAPTVAFPETFGLMIEPTESFSKAELEHFADTVKTIFKFALDHPEVLLNAPVFAPISRVNELFANREISLGEKLRSLPELPEDRITAKSLRDLPVEQVCSKILAANATISQNQNRSTEKRV